MKSLALLILVATCTSIMATDAVEVAHEGKEVVIRAGKNEILRYQAQPGELPRPEIPRIYLRGGYIRSIRTPSGRLITDDFPSDHLHHHGVWSPWTSTRFEGRQPDFWNMGKGTGTVEFLKLEDTWQTDGRAGFTARHQFTDLSARPSKVALFETWQISAASSGGNHVIDFTSTQTCASPSPLMLPEYHYGGFGFRGNAAWNGSGNCRFLSASGLTDREKLNASREKWCWIGGEVDGKTCGVTILCHPGNFRFPQPVRAHPDQPFFCYAPQQLGEMEIFPGKPYISRYRLVVSDGEPGAKVAEAWWTEYARER